MEQKRTITTWLFDCDDTLVCSETPAFQACCGVVNAVLACKGVDLEFTPETLKKRYVGCSFRHMVNDLAAEHDFSFADGELEKLVLDEQVAVTAKLENEAEETEGSSNLLERLKAKDKHRAVVSSSALTRVIACLKKTGQLTYFDIEHVFSAAALPTPTSKPDPAVYLWALEKLGKRANECVAVEDSVNGVKSAVAAGIAVLGFTGALPKAERAAHAALLKEHGAFAVVETNDEADDAVDAFESKFAEVQPA